jgi:hypothetical protein
MHYFETTRNDGRPLWKVIFDDVVGKLHAGELKVGDTLSHDSLRDLLTEEEQVGYTQAVLRAAKELRRKYKRSLQNVRGAGYQLIAGVDQGKQGQTHSKRARRNLSRALEIVRHTDRSIMSREDQNWTDRVENGMVALATIAAQHDEKLISLAEQMEALKSSEIKSSMQHQATASELEEIKSRLAEIERTKNIK